MNNILEFKPKKKMPGDDPYLGLTEEEYAVTLLRTHRMEQEIQDALRKKTIWVNEPDDIRDVLIRMSILHERLTGDTLTNAWVEKPTEPIKPTLWERIENYFYGEEDKQ